MAVNDYAGTVKIYPNRLFSFIMLLMSAGLLWAAIFVYQIKSPPPGIPDDWTYHEPFNTLLCASMALVAVYGGLVYLYRIFTLVPMYMLDADGMWFVRWPHRRHGYVRWQDIAAISVMGFRQDTLAVLRLRLTMKESAVASRGLSPIVTVSIVPLSTSVDTKQFIKAVRTHWHGASSTAAQA